MKTFTILSTNNLESVALFAGLLCAGYGTNIDTGTNYASFQVEGIIDPEGFRAFVAKFAPSAEIEAS